MGNPSVNKVDHFTVPTANIADNVSMRDVVGNKSDDETNVMSGSGASAMALLYAAEKHSHGAAKVYPTQGAGGAGWIAGASFSSHADAGTFGDYADLMPAGTAGAPFDIHWINIETLGANGSYELVIASGAPASEVEIGRVRFTRTAAQEAANGVPFIMPIKAAATRIRAKVACSAAGPVAVTVSAFYHEY